MKQPPEFISIDEAAELLRVNRKTLYAAIERGQIPGVLKIGRLLRVRRSALFEHEEPARIVREPPLKGRAKRF